MVNILFFAQVREKLQKDFFQFQLSQSMTVTQLVEALIEVDKNFEYLKAPHLFVAVNQTLCEREQLVEASDEVAFFPAVTGG
jgi:molybdopterin synthase sulfur carrier subunit